MLVFISFAANTKLGHSHHQLKLNAVQFFRTSSFLTFSIFFFFLTISSLIQDRINKIFAIKK